MERFVYRTRRKSLFDLVEKINGVLREKSRVTGTMIDGGEERSRTDSRGSTRYFEYRFLREVAREFIYSENGDEEGEEEGGWVERGIGLLERPFGENLPKINVTKRGRSEAKIEILYVPRKIEKLFKEERKVERFDEIEKMGDITEFAKIIYSCATFPKRKKDRIIEVRGEINETRHPPEFVATLALGVKYDGVKNMEDYKQFSEIYDSSQNKEGYSKSEEVNNRLILLENEIRKLPENPRFFVPKIAKGKTLEAALDGGRGVLVIRPFQ